MKDLLTNHLFVMVAIGTTLLGIASAMIGTITVLNKKSLIGDAIGHSSFPGIVIAFMIFSTRSPYVLLMGAVFSGFLAYLIIQRIAKAETHKTDTSLAVVLSGFFGLGMALNSYIQGNPSYQGASQSGLANYIFGQAAFITKQDLWLIFGVSLVSMLVMTLFYKEIKLYVFDAQYMEASGFNNKIIDTIITITMVAIIAAGLKVVGSILISSMLIAPVVAAMQWSKKYNVVVLIAALVGGLSSFIGTVFSSLYAGVSTGPAIVLVMSFIAILSIIFGRWGVVKTALRRRAIKNV